MSELPRDFFLSSSPSERLKRLRPYLELLAGCRFGSGRAADGSDCVQRTMIKIDRAWRKPAQAPNAGNPNAVFAWAGAIFRNEDNTMDRERRRRARERAGNHQAQADGAIGDGIAAIATVEDSYTPPLKRMERQETLARLAESLKRLSDLERRAIQLRFFDNFSAAEIARELGLANGNPKAARDLVYRALVKLRSDPRWNHGDSR